MPHILILWLMLLLLLACTTQDIAYPLRDLLSAVTICHRVVYVRPCALNRVLGKLLVFLTDRVKSLLLHVLEDLVPCLAHVSL